MNDRADEDKEETVSSGNEAKDSQLADSATPKEKATTEEAKKPEREGKVRIRLKAVGNAPILKQKKFYIGSNERVSVLRTFLQKQLKLANDSDLFLYCNSAFAPTLDQTIGELHESFKEHTTQDLIIDYGTVGAYG